MDHQDWRERLLSSEYLNYDARDARLIHSAFNGFKTAGWTRLHSLEESMGYVTFHNKFKDQYSNHSFIDYLEPSPNVLVVSEIRVPIRVFLHDRILDAYTYCVLQFVHYIRIVPGHVFLTEASLVPRTIW